MKKTFRLAAILLTGVLILFTFTGCKALDDMKKNQAFLNSDNSIVFNGEEYIFLNADYTFNPLRNDEGTYITVTEEKVPVLLSEVFGSGYILSKDKNFIVKEYAEEGIYCRADRYNEIEKRISEPFMPDSCCYSYYSYDEEKHTGTEKTYILTDNEYKTLLNILDTVKPTDNSPEYIYSISLNECSSDLLFLNDFAEILVCENKYYIMTHSDGLFVYEVPEKYNSILKNIVKKYAEIVFDSDFYKEDSF